MVVTAYLGDTELSIIDPVVGKIVTLPKTKVKGDEVLEGYMAAMDKEKSALQRAGVNSRLIDWIIIQDYMESGGYTNNGYRLYNNPGNIMWPVKGLKYGTKGGYNAINKTYYAKFKDIDEYVKQKMLVLSQSPGRPIDATTGEDFVHRLKVNNYFGKESEQSYADKMRNTAQRINLISSYVTEINTEARYDDNPGGNSANGFWSELPWYGKAGIGVGAFLIVLSAVKS